MEGVPIDLERLVRKGEQTGADEIEIYAHFGRYRYVEAQNNSLTKAVEDSKLVVGVRVVVNKRIASAGGEVSSEDDVQLLIEKAISLARASQEDPSWPGFNHKIGISKKPYIYDSKIDSLGLEDVASYLHYAIKEVKNRSGRAKITVASGASEAETVYSSYANSYGGPVEEVATILSFMVELKAEAEDGEGTYIDYFSKSRFNYSLIERTVRRSISRVVDSARATHGRTIKTTVILDTDEAASILGLMLSPAVSAEQVQKGRSPLKGKLGQQVFSSRITIIDDPFIDWEPTSSGFDDEGHPTRQTRIVGDGVLESYLYDHYTASIDGVESTGNASRPRPWSRPSPSPHNLVFMDKGSVESSERFLSQFDEAVLVVSTIGSWMSNPVSGQVNATVTLGYLLRHGSVEAVVKGLTWSDDVYRILRDGYAGSGGQQECRGGVCVGLLAFADSTLAGR